MSTTAQENPPKSEEEKKAQHDAHRDPLSGRAGAHPVGAGVGAATGGMAGAVTGAVIGTMAGPAGVLAGTAIGAAVGAVGGGLAGKAVAEGVNPTVEHGYWRENYLTSSYAKGGTPYQDYASAYQYGWEAQAVHPESSFDEFEATLGREWDKVKGASRLGWEDAKHAARDSWNRVRGSIKRDGGK